MGKLKDLVTGPYEVVGRPGGAQVVIDTRDVEGNPAIAASHSAEHAQLVADALNFYHNYAEAVAGWEDYTEVVARDIIRNPKPPLCRCGHPDRPGQHRYYFNCREE